jgi:hypothetical protein
MFGIKSKTRRREKEKKKKGKKEQKRKDQKQQKKNQEKLLPTAKNRTGNVASRVNSQCLYHDVFTTYLHHFPPNDLSLLKDIIQDIIPTLTSPPKRCTKNPHRKIQFRFCFMDHHVQGNHRRFFLGF